MAENGFDRIATSVVGSLARVLDGGISSTILELQRKAVTLQGQMMKYLATSAGVIGSASSPTFQGISLPQPKFKQLTEAYHDRKKAGSDNYFIYKGKLKQYLTSQASAVRNFGRPMVYYTQPGQRNQSAVYSTFKTKEGITSQFIGARGLPVKNFRRDQTRLGRISIDLYPKVPNLTEKMSARNYFPITMAYRLDNFQGNMDRGFLGQYMQWWLRVKGKQMVRGTVKGVFK